MSDEWVIVKITRTNVLARIILLHRDYKLLCQNLETKQYVTLYIYKDETDKTEGDFLRNVRFHIMWKLQEMLPKKNAFDPMRPSIQGSKIKVETGDL